MDQSNKCAVCNGRGHTDVGDPEAGATKLDFVCKHCAGTGICFFCGEEMDDVHDEDCPQSKGA